MARSQPLYIALTTTNAQVHGWKVLAYGHDAAKVQSKAEELIGDIRTDAGTDIYRETEHKNLRVVSKTTAKRSYGIDYDDNESWWLNCRDAVKVA